MSIRLQTWAPYEIQIALNGRQWLKRSLEKAGCSYIAQGNKFFDIDDYALAQQLLDSQLDTRWIDVFNVFLPQVFPSMPDLLGDNLGYYHWSLWQSEWARDYIFTDPDTIAPYMQQLLRHAFITGTSDRILRYFGHPVRPNGQPFPTAKPEIMTRINQWDEGARIRHWSDSNSIKLYNEHSVMRTEFTMNNPERYRIHRTAEGDTNGEKKLRPLRKGIADIVPRTQICNDRLNSFSAQLATLQEDITVGDILAKVSTRVKAKAKGKSFRALDVTGKDLALLKAIADPNHAVDAITNKCLQSILCDTPWANGLSGKKLSARISRHFRLLREHGIIKKMARQHKYFLTDKGKLLTTSLNQFLGASIAVLASLAA